MAIIHMHNLPQRQRKPKKHSHSFCHPQQSRQISPTKIINPTLKSPIFQMVRSGNTSFVTTVIWYCLKLLTTSKC